MTRSSLSVAERNGRMSTYLHDKAKVGDILDVSAPAGDFVLTPSVFPASPGSRRG